MGALTGNAVKDTYLDLVQLGKSGAGLPSHAGKEAAVYDGAGYQIIGRTAVRHWLDPHPDAASFDETWEFSTTGDMTQGQLETAGWTFENCTGKVENGVFWLTAANGSGVQRAYISTSLSGDFDIMACSVKSQDYNATEYSTYSGDYLTVADTVTTNSMQSIGYMSINGTPRIKIYHTGTYPSTAGTGVDQSNRQWPSPYRMARWSGTISFLSGVADAPLYTNITAIGHDYDVDTIADASTFNRIYLCLGSPGSINGDGYKAGWYFLRRFA